MIENLNRLGRRSFLKGTMGVCALGLAGCKKRLVRPVEKNEGKRPNLLFMFTDQQSFDMLGCYGNESVITPNIDKFAGEGVRFNHCISSSPVCSPMRAMLFSGQHPMYNGCFDNDFPMLPSDGGCFAHILKGAGYRTGYIGKWHLLGGDRDRAIPKGPYRYGFDDVFLTNNCHLDFRPGHCFYWNKKGEKIYFDEWEVYGQTRQAVQFLDECSNEQPFALFVSWHPPHDIGLQESSMHWNYDTEKELMDMYDPSKIKLRPNVGDSPGIRRSYHGYMANCTGVDIAFGRLMSKLKEKGFGDNTLVVFTSDHGDLLGSHGLTCPKMNPEDESVRVPLVMRYPELLKPNISSDLLAGTLDLMPTLLGLMGLKVPKSCHGKDLSHAIISRNDDVVESIPLMYQGFKSAWRGVYTRQVTYAIGTTRAYQSDPETYFKLVEVPANVLYDKSKDRYQQKNLFGLEDHRNLQYSMERLNQQWLDNFGEKCVDGEVIWRVYNQETQAGRLRRPIDMLNDYLSNTM